MFCVFVFLFDLDGGCTDTFISHNSLTCTHMSCALLSIYVMLQ